MEASCQVRIHLGKCKVDPVPRDHHDGLKGESPYTLRQQHQIHAVATLYAVAIS
jgi:hypothetical protein